MKLHPEWKPHFSQIIDEISKEDIASLNARIKKIRKIVQAQQ